MSEGIQGKVVLITGGGTGLGAETARLLASQGARVAVAGRRRDKLDAVVAAIDSAGGHARAYHESWPKPTNKRAIPASSVARAIAFAIERPADVDINEIVLRPTAQGF